MSRSHDWIGEIAGWVIYVMVQTFVTLVMVVVPAVFTAAVQLTAAGMIQGSRAGWWPLSPGGIMLVSTIAWPAVGLLLLPVVDTHGNPFAVLVEIVVIGLVFGICVGHQAMRLVEEAVLLEPRYDREQTFDVPEEVYQEQPRPQQTTETTLQELEQRFLQAESEREHVVQPIVVRERHVFRTR